MMDKKQPCKTSQVVVSNSANTQAQVANKLAATPYLDSVTRDRLWLALSVMKESKTQEAATIH